MANIRRLAGLADYDQAPDVYQTPELTDDASTQPTNADSTPSSPTSDSDPDRPATISRRPLHPTDARTRFQSSDVNTRNADFSDRIRRQNRGGYNVRERGEDGEEPETVQLRIKRLARELQELKAEVEDERDDETDEEGKAQGDSVQRLGQMLEEIRLQHRSTATSAQKVDQVSSYQPMNKSATQNHPGGFPDDAPDHPPLNEQVDEGALLRSVAAFDTRLAILESTIGPTAGLDGADPVSTPLQSGIDRLSAHLKLVSETTPASLETLGKQIAALTQASEKLVKSRIAAKSAADELQSARERELRLASITRSSSPIKRSARPISGTENRPNSSARSSASYLAHPDEGVNGAEPLPAEPSILTDPETLVMVHSLNGLLPTITDIAPSLPNLVRRLQSLRLVHAEAGNVKDDLDDLEARQTALKDEVAEWKAGLEKLASSLKQAELTSTKNAKTVEESIARMEKRVKNL